MNSQIQLQQRTRTMSFLVALLCVAASLNLSHAWMASTKTTPKTSLQPIQVQHPNNKSSAKFYKREHSSIISEDTARAVASETFSKSKPAQSQTPTEASPAQSQLQSELSNIKQLPWMQEVDGTDAEASKNVFVDLWDWQFAFFEEHLTNLRVRDVTVQHQGDVSIHDLYYATKASKQHGQQQQQQRVYTISLESDEYRDIRMTYMHCPGMQTFRCLSYPNNGDLPIMGMGIMKMGGSKHLAILDYQPLPVASDAPTNQNHGQEQERINDLYTTELLQLRNENPSMGQAMTRQVHFDSDTEQVKYFTESPMLGRCNELEATPSEIQTYKDNLSAAQKQYVAKHIELTQMFGKKNNNNANNSNKRNANDLSYVLERHSDFDTHVSEKEPAGPFLCGVFGPEIGGKLVHNVIFPLSQHGRTGHKTTTKSSSSP